MLKILRALQQRSGAVTGALVASAPTRPVSVLTTKAANSRTRTSPTASAPSLRFHGNQADDLYTQAKADYNNHKYRDARDKAVRILADPNSTSDTRAKARKILQGCQGLGIIYKGTATAKAIIAYDTEQKMTKAQELFDHSQFNEALPLALSVLQNTDAELDIRIEAYQFLFQYEMAGMIHNRSAAYKAMTEFAETYQNELAELSSSSPPSLK